jgi:putative addiction module component (TIGR02574 family)
MPSAPDTIEEDVLNWPAARRIRLAEKLMASVEDFAAPEIEAAWNTEIASRVAEIREGRADGMPAEQVMKEARKRLHEARRLSPAGRHLRRRAAEPTLHR